MDLAKAKKRLFDSLRREIGDNKAIAAMERVPREAFVPQASRHLAYEDIALPIGEGQTISQPLIVALMTQALELTRADKVLELGTGSGYQAAVLAELAGKVVTVERRQSLADSARPLLNSLGYSNIEVHLVSKTLGWLQEAPYDAILVTAGSPKLPNDLLNQIANGGRLVIPVGSRVEQELMCVIKSNDGYSVNTFGPCRFVPLVGEGAWLEEDIGDSQETLNEEL